MALSEHAPRRVRRTVGLLQDVVATFRSAHVPFLAGSIAYAAFVSLLPLLVLVALLASAIGGDAFVATVVGTAETYLSPTGQDFIAGTLERATARTGLSVLSSLVFIWAALRLFRSLDFAFSLLYGTEGRNDLLSQLLDGLIVLGAMVLAMVGTVVAGFLFAFIPALPNPAFVGTVALTGFLVVALLPMYYVFPDRSVTVWEVLPGTVVAALGWALLEVGFGLYVRLSSTAELYGMVGGVILVVIWLYFGALTVLLGATVNVVLSRGPPTGVDAVPV